MNKLISIHAPVKGATMIGLILQILLWYFNPRTREGCDGRWLYTALSAGRNFNPRTREGCDLTDLVRFTNYQDFNPRTREGCDSFCKTPLSKVLNFNPRTREGCDVIGIS